MDYEKALKIFELESLDKITFNDFRVLYKKFAKQKHPDTKSGTEKEFVKLREAYVLLSEHGEFADEHSDDEKKKSSKNALKISKKSKKQLNSLTKDEIINKYFKDTRKLENEIEVYRGYVDNQETIITKIKKKVKKITSDFDKEKDILKADLKKEIRKLEKERSPSLLERIFFFLPHRQDEEFWEKYNTHLEEYSTKYAELSISFFKLMLTCYGDGLNKITQSKEPKKKK